MSLEKPVSNDRPGEARAPYTPPALERLGRWSVLTLQQTIPVGPGGSLFPLIGGTDRLA